MQQYVHGPHCSPGLLLLSPMKLNSFTLLRMSIMSQFLPPPPLQPKKKATLTLSLGFNCDVYLKKIQIIDHKRYTYTCISLCKNFSLYFKLSVKLYPQKIHSPSLASYFNHQDYHHDFDLFFLAIQLFLCESVGGTCMGHLQVVTYYLSK